MEGIKNINFKTEFINLKTDSNISTETVFESL